jgi:hypothetical protein
MIADEAEDISCSGSTLKINNYLPVMNDATKNRIL